MPDDTLLARDVAPSDSVEKKFLAVRRLVLKLSRQYANCYGGDAAEAFADASLRLVEYVLPRWTPDRGALTTFVTRCLTNYFRSAARKQRANGVLTAEVEARPEAAPLELGRMSKSARAVLALLVGDRDTVRVYWGEGCPASDWDSDEIPSRRAARVRTFLSGRGWSRQKIRRAFRSLRGALYGGDR